MIRLPALTRGWRMVALAAAGVVFVAVLVDPTPEPIPMLGVVPPIVLATVWALLAFGWVWMVAGITRGFCWLRGEASCRMPKN